MNLEIMVMNALLCGNFIMILYSFIIKEKFVNFFVSASYEVINVTTRIKIDEPNQL